VAKSKPEGKCFTGISLVSLLIVTLLCLFIAPTTPTAASPEADKWTRVNIPTEGSAGNWVLANGSDIQYPTAATDGSLYAYAQGLTYTLYKSTDGGYNWRHIGNVQDSIVAIATSPQDADFICYATSSDVYLSTNGGGTFSSLPANPGGAGSNNVEITTIDIAWVNGHIIIAGTRDTDSGQYGGVYTLDREQVVASWADTNLGSYDVYAVAASPNFTTDRQIVAVVTNETDTLVTTRFGDAVWGASVGNAILDKDNSGTPTPIVVADSAAIAFPGDYEADASSDNYLQFIAIDTGTGTGDVFKIKGAEAPEGSVATDLNVGAGWGLNNVDVTGLAASGDSVSATLLAGSANNTRTYFSNDGGTGWTRSRKMPTGDNTTYVLSLPDSGKAYVATSGGESAFSVSQGSGDTWSQISLIDTGISTIVDLAPSPSYSQDETMFMLTFGSEHSLWQSTDGCTTWERIFTSTAPGVDSLALIQLSPQYGTDSQVLFLAGSSNGNPAIWKSTSNGQSFSVYTTRDPTTGNSISIDTWALVSDTELFLGSFDGSNGRVYRSTNGGFSFLEGALCGSQSLNSITLSPDYSQDETILIGNSSGWVYQSGDNGVSFTPMPHYATSAPLTGALTVACDPEFASNNIIYAASITADEGVYRFTIGTSSEWDSIDGTLPSGGKLNQVVVSPDGTLYAANSKAGGGTERCLNPTYSLGPTFETVTRGVSDDSTLTGLWQHEDRLWSIDTTNVKLMTFTESLVAPVNLLSPVEEEQGIGIITNHTIINVRVDWEAWSGATSYEWQLDYDTDFSSVPSGFEGSTKASMVRLPTLEPATTYYWRVRATAPVLSPWSDKWSFTTSLDSETVTLRAEIPEAGATEVSISPLFQWSAVAGADGYEVLVCTDADFDNPSITKVGDYALSSTAWQCNVKLMHETTYYWKVRAVSASTHSAWSASSTFTTESAPAPPEESSPEPPVTTALQPKAHTTPPLLLPPPTGFQSNMLTLPPTAPPLPPPAPVPAQAPAPSSPELTPYLMGALFLIILLLLITILILAVRMSNR